MALGYCARVEYMYYMYSPRTVDREGRAAFCGANIWYGIAKQFVG